MEKLLMLGTSYGTLDMLAYAKSRGVYTIVTDYLPPEQSPGKQVSDEYWMINTGDVDALEAKCREEGVTGVICGISEFNLEMCMELCKRLGKPCYCTPEAWHYSRDKVDFKELCRKLGAPLPTDYYVSEALTDEELDKVVFPVVVKPVDLSCNRGISYCNNKDELRAAYKLARSMSKSDKIVVERMLKGEEWYSFYALAQGKVSLMGLCAMYAQPGEPKNCYSITSTISNHVESYIEQINPYMEKVLGAVGCREGIAWMQVMLDEDGKFYIIEMGYRLDGDMMYIPFKGLLGFDTTAWLVDYALGKINTPAELPKPQEHAYRRCASSYMLWTNKGGTIASIEGLDEIAAIPGIYVDSLARVGDEVHKYMPLGDILFDTDTIDETFDIIRRVNDTVSIKNTDGEDILIRYTDFDYLRNVYQEGLEGR